MGATKPDINIIKKKEAYIEAELYRVLKNSLALVAKYPSSFVLQDVVPQYPVNDKKADLVVMGTFYRDTEPLLVIETKQRVYTREGPSYANAVKQAKKYAEHLDAKYFGIYDGWMLMLFDSNSPYLISIYNAQIETRLNEEFAKKLLTGLLDLRYSNKKDELDRLTKFGDADFLWKKILPSIAKMFIKYQLQKVEEKYDRQIDEEEERENLLRQWKEILPI